MSEIKITDEIILKMRFGPKAQEIRSWGFEYPKDKKEFKDFKTPSKKHSDFLKPAKNFTRCINSNIKNGKMLYLASNTGGGKTLISQSLFFEALIKGVSVEFVCSSDLGQMVESVSKNQWGADPFLAAKSNYLNKLKTCDLLIIDDLASEFESQRQHIIDFLHRAYGRDQALVITTNLKLAQKAGVGQSVQSIYGQRTYSRICERAIIVEENLPDWRMGQFE